MTMRRNSSSPSMLLAVSVLAAFAPPLLGQSSQAPAVITQTAPANGANPQPPQFIIHSDKPLTPEEEAAMKARIEAMRKLPPASPLIPNFELEAADGSKIMLKALHGKIVLLDYWATWCAPCVEALPQLDAVYQKYRDNPRVSILSVNPLMGDSAEKARAFAEQKHLAVPLAFDHHFGHDTTAKTPPTSLVSLPVVLLLDGTGKQVWFSNGGAVGDTGHHFEQELIARIDAELAR